MAIEGHYLKTFREDGFLILRKVFSTETVSTLQKEASRIQTLEGLIHDDNFRCRFQSHSESGESLFDALDPVTDLSESIKCTARDAKIIDAVSELLGERAHLFKDKLIYKAPQAKGYSLHQDFISWKGFPETFTTVVVALDHSHKGNGCIHAYRGSHKKGYLSQRDGDYHDLPSSLFDANALVHFELDPGDIAIFGCFLVHGSPPNRTEDYRRQLYLSYNAHSDGGDQRAQHYEEFHRWLKKRYAEYGYNTGFFK